MGLGRRLRMVSGPQGADVLLDGRPVLLLCSNNYLGLADHPRVREAAAEAAMRWGVGAGASRLVSGTMTIHRRLEERLAAFERVEACLLFGSGYLANIGVHRRPRRRAATRSSRTSSTTPRSSTAAGCRGAEVSVYGHRDLEHLEWACAPPRRAGGRALIVTDTVFSMDGDVAPLAGIVELARAYDARTSSMRRMRSAASGPAGAARSPRRACRVRST